MKSLKDKGVVLIEVKSGNVTVKNICEFIQVLKVENGDIGVFVCFREQVTKPMLIAAKNEGHFDQEHYKNRIDEVQIITIEDLFEGDGIKLPDQFFM